MQWKVDLPKKRFIMYSQMACVVLGAEPSKLRHRLTINTLYQTTANHTYSHLEVDQIHEQLSLKFIYQNSPAKPSLAMTRVEMVV